MVNDVGRIRCKSHPSKDVIPGRKCCEICIKYFKNRKKRISINGMCRNHINNLALPGKNRCQICYDKDKSSRAAREKHCIENSKCLNHPVKTATHGKFCPECRVNKNWLRIKNTYGLTKEQYILECEKRNYRCDLCDTKCLSAGSNSNNKKTEIYQIDHDHVTGEIRGFLCYACNVSLGQFKENKDRISNFTNRIAGYLKWKLISL